MRGPGWERLWRLCASDMHAVTLSSFVLFLLLASGDVAATSAAWVLGSTWRELLPSVYGGGPFFLFFAGHVIPPPNLFSPLSERLSLISFLFLQPPGHASGRILRGWEDAEAHFVTASDSRQVRFRLSLHARKFISLSLVSLPLYLPHAYYPIHANRKAAGLKPAANQQYSYAAPRLCLIAQVADGPADT